MRFPRRGYVAGYFGFVVIVSLAIVGYLATTGEQMASRHTPQIDAAMEIKFNAAMGHLWFEEIIAGDRNEQIEDVWGYLEASDWYARALLEGGQNQEGTFVPLKSPTMRRQIESVREALARFRTIAEQRYSNFEASLPGSDIDQKFDRIFYEFIDEADQVETLLQESIVVELAKFKQTVIFLTAMLLGTGFVVTVLLYYFESQRTLHLSAIEQKNEAIERKNSELDYLAHFDHTSGLPNRTLFTDRLNQAIGHAERKSNSVALLFIDLDRFKSVNDRLGHARGDELLKHTANRLQQSLRADDSVARIGGDEFTIILADLDDGTTAATAAQSVAEHILGELTKPFDLGGLQVALSASVGIAIYPLDADDPDNLLINADHAMYESKQQHPGHYCFFSRELEQRVQRKVQISHDLQGAVKDNQFTVHYQPQWDLQKEAIVGFEALVRWQHPEQGLLAPDSFLGVAEATGLIEEIDLIVLNQVCRLQQEWAKLGLPGCKMSVNFSAILFSRPEMAQILASRLAEYCLRTENLQIELTETAMLQDMKHTRELCAQLMNLGIPMAIDDFGTGYSSMAYLNNFPAKVLKIDRTFIHEVDKNRTAQAIVRSMLELAGNLGMEVVAEGIETEQEKVFLQSAGCSYGQGYLLGKPMAAEQAEKLLLACQDDNVAFLSP